MMLMYGEVDVCDLLTSVTPPGGETGASWGSQMAGF